MILHGYYYLSDERELEPAFEASMEITADDPLANQLDYPSPLIRMDISRLTDKEVKAYLNNGIKVYEVHLGKEVSRDQGASK